VEGGSTARLRRLADTLAILKKLGFFDIRATTTLSTSFKDIYLQLNSQVKAKRLFLAFMFCLES
jgi:hypothetical protein